MTTEKLRSDALVFYGATGDLESALGLDDLTNVGRVALAEVCDDALFQRIELTAERFGLLGCEGDGLAADGLLKSPLLLRDGRCSHGSIPFVR